MQHKGIIGFPFFYFVRIMILDFQVFFCFPSLLYNFLLNPDARPMFCSLNSTCMLRGVVGNLNLTWILQFKMLRVLLFGVDLSYIFNFCTFTTFSFTNVLLGFVFHIHFHCSNIYILRFLHLEIIWDLILNFFFTFLESFVGICCWNWNILLETFVEFEFQIQEILKILFNMN
jgi:hypothetical protein